MSRRSTLALLCLAGLAACHTAPLNLNTQQQDAVGQAQSYLNGLTRFQARFTQTGSFGDGAGWLWVDRPGRLRLSYQGPRAQEMVARDGTLVVFTPANGATTTLPVARTPLGLLLAQTVSLSGTVAMTAIQQTADSLTFTLLDRTHPQQGTLTMVLSLHPMVLIGVTAIDAHNRRLQMTLTDINPHPIITPDLFRYPGTMLPG